MPDAVPRCSGGKISAMTPLPVVRKAATANTKQQLQFHTVTVFGTAKPCDPQGTHILMGFETQTLTPMMVQMALVLWARAAESCRGWLL
jgi:hypothetical protein